MDYQNRITYDQKILAGKPIIKRTRIPVELILKLLAQGIGHDEILQEYPDLTKEDILAVMAYARDAIAFEEVVHTELKTVAV